MRRRPGGSDLDRDRMSDVVRSGEPAVKEAVGG